MTTTQTENTALAIAPRQQFDLSPQNFEQALTFSNYLADSDLVPKDFKGKAGNCLIAMQWGAELGLKPLQALQNLAIINGRPSLWGDAVLALVRGSPACEWVIEEDNGDTATCRVKRRGEPEQSRSFSMHDAKAAGLAGKQGPWTQYPKRMRQMRARAFALRDVFPDVLRGLPIAEEVQDTPLPGAAPAPVAAPPSYPEDKFAANLPEWTAVIQSGRKTADDFISFAATRGTPYTAEQIAKLRAVTKAQATDVTPKPAASTGAAGLSADDVRAKLQTAADVDALNVAADLIGEVADPEQRAELSALYDQRNTELNPQE